MFFASLEDERLNVRVFWTPIADCSEFSVEKNSSDTNGRYPYELNVR